MNVNGVRGFLIRLLFFFWLGHAILEDIACDLDVEEGSDQIVLFLDLLQRPNNKQTHLLGPKVVRDSCVELRAQFVEKIWSTVLNCFLYVVQNVKTLKHCFFRELAKGHALYIDIDGD